MTGPEQRPFDPPPWASSAPPPPGPDRWRPAPPGRPPGRPHGPVHGPPPGVRQDEVVWAVVAHLSLFVVGILGPLVVYLVHRETSPFVRHHAVEALNFQITLLLATFVCIPLLLVLIGFVLLPLVVVGGMVLAVVAAVAAGSRRSYRYPFTARLVH